MFALRRVTLSAFAQPARHFASVRPVPRLAELRTVTSSFQRSLHQSQRWLVEEEQKTLSTEPQNDAIESSAGHQRQESGDANVVTSNAADQAQGGPVSQIGKAISNAAGSVSSAVSSATGLGQRSQPVNDATLYIGNLFFEATASQLENEFARFGPLKNTRIVTDHRGQSRGFAFVEFENPSDAEDAIRDTDQKVFQGRRMAVQLHRPKPPRHGQNSFGFGGAATREASVPSRTLFIGNMSYQMNDRDLNDLFREVRNVLDVRVAIDRRSGQPRGFAHADFTDIESATKAKELLEQKVVYGRPIRVDFGKSAIDSPRDSLQKSA